MPSQRRKRRGLALLAVPALIICASAIYASIIRDHSTATTDVIAPHENNQNLVLASPDMLQDSLPRFSAENDIPPEPEYLSAQSMADALLEPDIQQPILPTNYDMTSSQDSQDEAQTVDNEAIPGRWLEETVKSGDSLALIFDRLGLTAKQLHAITHSSEEAEQLADIRPGESLRVRLDDQDRLLELVYQHNAVKSLHITPHEDGFQTRTETKEPEPRTGYLSGSITSSFYVSAKKAGLSDALIMDLATIFGWDIDFALEIREGDSFSVIFEEDFVGSDKYGSGRILAAEFTNHGKTYRAIRYEKDNGDYDYYSPDGKSMRKAFLRAPVDFRRISSRFSKERYHPVLGKKRPHRGVDYAAAIGTPIKAAGDGKVVFRGSKSGYGNTVIIKHGSQYSTLYGHMSRFRSAVKNGSKVRQGDVIGYVGKTGLATGPHLHYEFRINGLHKNPLTVKLPASAPIENRYKEDFLRISRQYVATLELLSRSLLAQATTE